MEKSVIWILLFIGSIFGANWAIETFGVVPVGFGLMAPAGVYFAGLAFTFRDLIHETKGRRWVIGAIVVGAVISMVVSPALALASGVAFLLSESLDFAVYLPLREKGLALALVGSNIVGLVVDSVVFLFLAFGSLEFLFGQIVGKAWMTVLALVLIPLMHRHLARKNAVLLGHT